MTRRRRPIALVGLVTALGLAPSACQYLPNPAAPPRDPTVIMGRFTHADAIVVAGEVSPKCKLETLQAADLPQVDDGWHDADLADLVGRPLSIEKRSAVLNAEDVKPTFYRALLVRGRDGSPLWLRNAPVRDMDGLEDLWSCVLPQKAVDEAAAKLTAGAYRLALAAPRCQGASPMLGHASDVVFTPYVVKERLPILDDRGELGFALTLVSGGGAKKLETPSSDLARCFAAADTPPPPADEVDALTAWLKDPAIDQDAPPSVGLDTLVAVAGVDPSRCASDGAGPVQHLTCAAPVVRIEEQPRGKDTALFFSRARVVEALHVYGGKLVAAADAADVNAIVRLSKGSADAAVSGALDAALARTAADLDIKRARAARGFRLLRPSDALPAQIATHYVDVELSYAIPEIESTNEKRTHHYVAGKKRVVNPAYAAAKKELADAKADLETAHRDSGLARDAEGELKKTCKNATGALSLLCDTGKGAAKRYANGREKEAKERIDAAREALHSTPKTTLADDVRDLDYLARIVRRHGEALARVSIAAAGGGEARVETTLRVPFDVADVDIPSDPLHQLAGHTATPPSPADAEAAIADALVGKLDDFVAEWTLMRGVRGADVASTVPGARAWVAGVARRAAGGRAVKLVDDFVETSADALTSPAMIAHVHLPEGADARCYTFAASPLDGRGDANLTLSRAGSSRVIAKDERLATDAAFELCDLAAGDYDLSVSFAGIISMKGVTVSLFESTAGAFTDADVAAAAQGAARRLGVGDALTLGSEPPAASSDVTPGKPKAPAGDRDGDGVPDDRDRCPDDPETKNGYLDDDGCPDAAPSK